ncbi:AAA family ATPase [Neptunomonas japonica]|uniref:Endonuclease GajA/Old nuclease/RecF-like AAA domain-containing protein n=1 Tax=Neptunomonas japonica JAMM 1380 TaxID=1441457 RepID=A0A7R6PHI3_9GAMM|nr:AAA family ATPase [Neptunomonas japonica]BBB30322.1 conserved hypothetical protein [Neptunomonas japonica JAMM 1380]
MLTSIEIKNYKSAQDLKLNLGRVNVFIGENGSGKSNILEAIGLASAASAYKLDNEFLSSRGIRVTSADLMKSCFEANQSSDPITLTVFFDRLKNDEWTKYILTNDLKAYSKWECEIESNTLEIDSDDPISEFNSYFKELLSFQKKRDTLKIHGSIDDKGLEKEIKQSRNVMQNYLVKLRKSQEKNNFANNYVIYSPENSALRNFYKEGQIEPLGINGEGLLKLLKVLHETDPEVFSIIEEKLKLFGWFESIKVPTSLSNDDDKIEIKDRHINKVFDQRSANEGFLFVLFYTALFVSTDTPSIFAIDNIDASLNPKLCTKIIKDISELAKRFDKQVLLTTHNPAILDGLDLNDREQKLFVVNRSKVGATRCKEISIENKPKSASDEPLKMSEAFLRGYLGGLPKSF